MCIVSNSYITGAVECPFFCREECRELLKNKSLKKEKKISISSEGINRDEKRNYVFSFKILPGEVY